MEKGISFHSIYYRYFTFIFALLILFFYVVGKRQGFDSLDVDLSVVKRDTARFACDTRYELKLSPGEFALCGNGILLLVSLPFYFYKKLKVGREGIYLPSIKLFVPWEEINAVSHVWISEACLVKKEASFFITENPSFFIEKKRSRSVFITSRFFPSMP